MNTIDLDTQLGQFRVYAEGTVTRALQAGQWWDAHLKPHIDEASDRGGDAVDVGAHVGWFTRYLAQRFRAVYACEPWPASFALLQHNLRMAGGRGVYDDAQLWPVAAYNQQCALGFSPANDLTDAGTFAFCPLPGAPSGMVVGLALDAYLPADAPVSLIKCDAQGADLRALQGMEKTIRRCRPLILFEWEEAMARVQDSTWDDYLAFFDRLGYQEPERVSPGFWDYCARPK